MQALFLLIGLIVGGAGAWFVLARRAARLTAALSAANDQVVRLSTDLEIERRTAEARAESQGALETRLKALQSELQKEARDDLEARQRAMNETLAPLREQLDRVGTGIRELEKARSETHGALTTQIRDLVEAQSRLQGETASLASAMRSTGARGRWGEVQLRRIVELAGMVSYADFVEQQTVSTGERTLRPDLVVRLPGGRNIVIDAKVPFDRFMEASSAPDEPTRQALLREHVKAIRGHVTQLSAKAYSEPFEPTPGFVVMFIPADSLFHAALETDASLIEDAIQQGVLLTSPVALIALLKSVSQGWRQEKVAESAREVSALGKQLYDRLAVFAEHFARLRKGLDGAVDAYNHAVGSLERQVLVSARRFPDLGVPAGREIIELEPIQQSTRTPQAPELAARVPDAA